MVYLHSARVFHSLMVLSREPDTIWRLSAEKAPEFRSHRRMVASMEPVSANWPSEEITVGDGVLA